MSIFDRTALEASPLADLHAIASELSIDGHRRLRKADLIDRILQRQEGGGDDGASPEPEPAAEPEASGEPEAEASQEPRATAEPKAEAEAGTEQDADEGTRATPSRRRGRRGGRGRGAARAADDDERRRNETEAEPQAEAAKEAEPAEQEVVEGVVELLTGGSGFVRVHPPGPSDDDVYISSAQVKRCELVRGDRVSGPRRAPRRSERFASLVRVDTVNDRPATELADGVRFEDLPIAFPNQRIELAGGDPALEAMERAVGIGRGSRITIVGPPAAGKSELLRRLTKALATDESSQLWLVLVGVRPEEVPEWKDTGVSPAASLSFAASADAQSQALDGVVEQVRRLVTRGTHAVVLIDTLDGVLPAAAGKALASARNVVDGGSLTVVATASRPLGGETGVVTLQRPPADADGAFPAIESQTTWTIRRELLG
ncbi:MAG: Rho termination factor N-terminal domain-containing protein [Solirubrobacteraceae bacterium]